MHYLNRTLIYSLLLCAVSSSGWAQVPLSACLEQGKKEFSLRDFNNARNTFQRCLSIDPKNTETLLSLAAVQMKTEDLNGARASFLEALKHIKRSSPYLSYTYSMLGDIALKQQQNKAALTYYNRSLTYNEANVNSLVGKGVIIESQGDKKGAAKVYETALAVEPLNIIARKRLIALEPIYFSDEEMLEAMKQRYAVEPDKKELTKEDRELFSKIHEAEQRGGVDYLKSKLPLVPQDYTATLFKGTDFAREVLTLNGYNALQKQVGQDAINVFQKMNIRIQDIFKLRDMKGNKIFTDKNTLTDSGYLVYNEALQGRKAYLLPNEAVPPTQAFLEKVNKRVKELKESGYTEISRAEMALIKQQTNCSEKTMLKSLGLYILPVTTNDKRYFVLSREGSSDKKSISWYYVARYRNRRDPSVKVPANKMAEMYASLNYKICHAGDGELME